MQEKHDAMDRLPKELTGMMVSGDMLWVIAIDEGAKDVPAHILAFAALNPDTNADLIFAGKE